MQKLKTVFVIDRSTGLATDEVQKGAEWIMNGDGRATVKFDGSSVLIDGGKFYRRLDRKLTKKFSSMKRRGKLESITKEMFSPAKEGWIPAEQEPDLVTGHWPGWMPIDVDNNADKWHVEAINSFDLGEGNEKDGTYELVGPTLQQNIYGLDSHMFVKHGSVEVDVERSFDGIKKFLEENYIEGLVFHPEDDGPMFKVRRKDFGIVWNPLSDTRHYPNWDGEVEIANLY